MLQNLGEGVNILQAAWTLLPDLLSHVAGHKTKNNALCKLRLDGNWYVHRAIRQFKVLAAPLWLDFQQQNVIFWHSCFLFIGDKSAFHQEERNGKGES